MSEEVLVKVERAIREAGQNWLNHCYAAGILTMEPGDVPKIIYAQAAIDELRRLNLLSDGERVGK